MRLSALRLPLGAAAIALALGGCGDPASPQAVEPSTAPDGSTQAAPLADPAAVCPAKLPRGDDPEGHGFGTQEDAQEQPALPAPEQAWTCRYDAVDAGQSPSGGTAFAWVRHGSARDVAGPRLADLATALGQVVPFENADRMCTADLGPRWLVAYRHSDRVMGVVVDGYGCREVRLTDDPKTTPPGAAERDGTVPGVLDGGADVLAALGLSREG